MFNLMLALLFRLINTSNTEANLFQAHENNGNLPGVRCIIRDYKEIILSRNDTCSNIFTSILKSHDFITVFAKLLSHRVNFLSLLTECVICNKGECGFDQPIIGLDILKEQFELEYEAARRAYNDLEIFLMNSFDEQTPEISSELTSLYKRQRTDIIKENAELRNYSFNAIDEIFHFSVVCYTTFADSKSLYGIYDKNIEQQLLTTESRIRLFVMLITKHLNWQEKTRKRHRQAKESWLQITNE